jgi:hypothetical protein
MGPSLPVGACINHFLEVVFRGYVSPWPRVLGHATYPIPLLAEGAFFEYVP